MLDGEGVLFASRITRQDQFNYGPTPRLVGGEDRMYSWTILEVLQESQSRFSGHGSAIAQAYNHTILPLSNQRDNRRRFWGIRDFEYRLAANSKDVAAGNGNDMEVLDILAGSVIRFIDPSPRNSEKLRARSMARRRKGHPSTPYSRLPSGRRIAVFSFQDQPAIAFEGLLEPGKILQIASRLRTRKAGHGRRLFTSPPTVRRMDIIIRRVKWASPTRSTTLSRTTWPN
jgi:hypothetical protein